MVQLLIVSLTSMSKQRLQSWLPFSTESCKAVNTWFCPLFALSHHVPPHRVCTALKEMFATVGKSADFPKMFNTRKYPEAILRLGSVNYSNTAGREAAIKPLRACWEHTNKQPRTLGQQVAKQAQVFESLGAARKQQQAGAQPPRKPEHGVVSTSDSSLVGAHFAMLDVAYTHVPLEWSM